MTSNSRRLAVLIDGDFINPAHLGRVLAEVEKHGTVMIRRIYGSHSKLLHWKESISHHGIEPVPNRVNGKNVADTILTIHAVEILRSGKGINGVCIVASDNDFVGLVNWLRGKEVFVMGIGSSYAPPLDFKRECDVFKYVEKLPQSDSTDSVAQKDLWDWKETNWEDDISYGDNDWVRLPNVGSSLK